jgi:DNA-binding NarL/FixJ family response regulator
MSLPRVVIVDDHALFRSGVRAELDGAADVVGEAADVDEAVAVIRATAPDVVLLDVHLPGGGGAEVLRRLGDARDAVRCLALSVSDAPADVIELIQHGARGYVTKTIAPAELAAAIVRVAEGDAVFSPRLAGFVLDAFARAPAAPAPAAQDPALESLTPREREILEHIARGYLYKEVAAMLGLSVRTVESHVAAVLRKLQLANRHQLAHWAAQRRLAE